MSERIEIPPETRLAQANATHPENSAWVSANAGSGKTFVLTRRVIRLLISGVAPSKILCLTYTKAAAAEMSNRIFSTLGKWASLDEAGLRAELAEVAGALPSARDLDRARTLFALSLDSPGGLRIQTIHGFCEALLHQFPLEANVSGHFEVIDDARQERLLAEARRATILDLDSGSGNAGLRRAWDRLLAIAGDETIEKALTELMAKREVFLSWAEDGAAQAIRPLWLHHGIGQDTSEEELLREGLAQSGFSAAELLRIAEAAAAASQTTNKENAKLLEGLADSENDRQRVIFWRKLFLTQKNTPKANSSILTAAITNAIPGLSEKLEREKLIVFEQYKKHQAWKTLAASQALFEIGLEILKCYLSLKRRSGLVDFSDLIGSARNLLARSQMRAWVQYKLDRGIDHVLVDEAQDTSPAQWEIIRALTDDFHSGEGAGGRVRTVFAVGDEKQSIYSFQGADPRKFSAEAAELERRTLAAGKPFQRVPLHLSFRSAPDILFAVDEVFSIEENFRGLSHTETSTVHGTVRMRDPGEVLIWPLVGKEKRPQTESWIEPFDHAGEDHPAEKLALRIASTIRGWIDRREKLPGRDRPLRCGDILILVRRRDQFSTAVIRRLKEFGLDIAGADRLRLTEHIAVEDLLALGRVMLMPEDDLSLASVLKSPLFGFDDDDLIAVATGREDEPLYDHLALLAGDHGNPLAARAGAARDRLESWRAKAMQSTPYGFYAHVLGRGGGRKAFLSRLGTEAADVLDAFEQAALDHSKSGGKGLEDFIAGLVRASPEIKREVDTREDKIRVITVHSAKGLEAPVVFLVDPCSPAFSSAHRPAVVQAELGGARHFLWAACGREASSLILDEDERIASDAAEEYRRLLYVGMTRAADRLIVCGWHGQTPPKHPHWHSMICNALLPQCTVVDAGGDWTWHRWTKVPEGHDGLRREVPLKPEQGDAGQPLREPAAWLAAPVRREPPIPRPLTPSGAAALLAGATEMETDAGDVPPDPGLLAAAEQVRRFALERGTVTHLLLQLLPGMTEPERGRAAVRIIERHAGHWPDEEKAAAMAEAFALIDDPVNALLFGEASRAEVNVAGNVKIAGRDVLVSGQIDRLAITGEAVEIADYKTNREAPENPHDAPQAYVLQLALYRELMRQIYPGRRISCRLIWTRSGRVSPVGDGAMDAALEAMTIE